MTFSRYWQMPNSETFSIPVIGDFVKKYLSRSRVSVDPFARNKRWATYTNDLNPETEAEHHLECEDFLRHLAEKGVKADLFIMDSPYSPRQVKEVYDGIGRKMKQEDAWGGAMRKRRRELMEPILCEEATVLTFGWDTNGIGKRCDGLICPISQAVKRATGNTVCVSQNYFFLLSRASSMDDFKLPQPAIDFIAAFDAGKPVEPFSFEVEV